MSASFGRQARVSAAVLRRRWRRVVVVVVSGLAVVTAAVTLDPQRLAAQAPREVVIGAVIPMTGGNAASGGQMKNGYEMAVDEINQQGGIKSLGGARLRLVVRDSEDKPDVGARQAQALIGDEKALVLVGSYSSAVAVTVARVAERLKTPYAITDGVADELTESGFKYLFRIDTKGKLISREVLRALKWAGEKSGAPVTKIALLNEDTAYGQAMKKAFEQAVGEFGVTLADNLVFKTGTPDLSPQAARLKASGAFWVVGAWYAPDVLTMLNTFPGLGVNPTRAITYGGPLQNPSTLKLGTVAEGALGFTMWNPDVKLAGAAEWGERFKRRFNVDAVMNAAKAYRGVWVVKDVLERAGSVDKVQIREAFTKTNISSGPAMIVQKKPITFDEAGQMNASLIMIQVQKGVFKTVWPEDVASVPLDWTRVKQGLVLK